MGLVGCRVGHLFCPWFRHIPWKLSCIVIEGVWRPGKGLGVLIIFLKPFVNGIQVAGHNILLGRISDPSITAHWSLLFSLLVSGFNVLDNWCVRHVRALTRTSLRQHPRLWCCIIRSVVLQWVPWDVFCWEMALCLRTWLKGRAESSGAWSCLAYIQCCVVIYSASWLVGVLH